MGESKLVKAVSESRVLKWIYCNRTATGTVWFGTQQT
jgi:hypothetical protein